ncbi:hypothetical protein F4779DRAFT_584288 [Xylariaceae sp. FL0662B]|nr:hypothetical protein F4779DRAFT_584288 [Xylariaceae sp. FL0662B]
MRLVSILGIWVFAFTGLSVGKASPPNCAVPCLAAALEASPCEQTDVACQCTNVELANTAEICILRSCTVIEALSAKNLTQTQCGAPVRDRRYSYDVISWTLLGASALIVFTRIVFIKFFSSSTLGLDDLFVFLTLVNITPAAIINAVLLTANGIGKDIWTLTPDQITSFGIGFYIITILYFSEVYVLKLALLFFYLRIFPGHTIRRLLWGTVAFDVLFGISFIFTAIFQCQPINYNWNSWKGEGGGRCANTRAIASSNAAISIVLDLWMLALPLSQLKKLKLHWKKKVGVALMFCVGTFVTVVSVIRLSSLVEFRSSDNLTWDFYGISLWSTVEITVGIICACMPAMRLILIRIAPKIFEGSSARRGVSYYGNRGGSGDRSYGDRSAPGTRSDFSANRKSVGFSYKSSYRNTPQFGPVLPPDDGYSSDKVDLVPLKNMRSDIGGFVTISSPRRAETTRVGTDRETPSPTFRT